MKMFRFLFFACTIFLSFSLKGQVLMDHAIVKTTGEFQRFGDAYYQTGIYLADIQVGIGDEAIDLPFEGSSFQQSIFLVKYDLDLKVVWAKSLITKNNFRELSFNYHEGFVYVFYGTVFNGEIEHNCQKINADNPDENFQLFRFKTGVKGTLYENRISDDGSIAIVGELRDNVKIDALNWSEEYLVSGTTDIYVINYNSESGWVNYSHHLKRGFGYPGVNNRKTRAVTFDRNNNLHVIGKAEGSIQVTTNDGPVLTGGSFDFRASFNVLGDVVDFEHEDYHLDVRGSKVVTLESGYAIVGVSNFVLFNEDFDMVFEKPSVFYGNNEVKSITMSDSSITILIDVSASSNGKFEIFNNVIIPTNKDYVIVDMDFTGKPNWYTYFGADSQWNFPESINYLENGNLLVGASTQNPIDIDPSLNKEIIQGSTSRVFFLAEYEIVCNGLNLELVDRTNVSCAESGSLQFNATGGTAPVKLFIDGAEVENGAELQIENSSVYSVYAIDATGCSKEVYLPISGPSDAEEVDLNLLHFSGVFRTGFDTNYKITINNKNCNPTSGHLDILLDHLIEYKNADLLPSKIDGQRIEFDFEDLVFEENEFQLNLDLRIRNEAIFGEDLCIEIKLFDEDGSILENSVYCSEVVNSYDPNDISVLPYGRCEENYFLEHEDLVYLIRFQNLGNAEAINVEILDTLSNSFDISSIEILESSHNLISRIEQDSILILDFSDINLPAKLQDEKASNGYVFYKINTISELPIESTVQNKAAIYFDHNEPVITNEVTSTLIDVLPSCVLSDVIDLQAGEINVYPNPVHNIIKIEVDSKFEQVALYDISGQKIESQIEKKVNHVELDVSFLKSGLYFIKIQERGYRFYKL